MDDNDPMRFIRGFVAALQVTGEKLRPPAAKGELKTILADLNWARPTPSYLC